MLRLPCAGDGASVCRAPRGGVPLRPCRPPPVASLTFAFPPADAHAIGVRDRYLGQNHHPVIFRDDVNAKVALFDFKLACPGAPGFRRVGLVGVALDAAVPPGAVTYYLSVPPGRRRRRHAGAAGSSLLAEGRKSLSPSLLGAVVSVPTLASRRAHLDTFAIPLRYLCLGSA